MEAYMEKGLSEFKNYIFRVTETRTTYIEARGRTAGEAAKMAGIVYADTASGIQKSTCIVQMTFAEEYLDSAFFEQDVFREEFLAGISDYES